MERNNNLDNIPDNYKKMFRKLSWITEKYKKNCSSTIEEVNEILKPINKYIDYMLMSVSLITEYYRQMRGKKRHFTHISYNEIVSVEEECIEKSNLNINDTFDIAEILVRELLKDK